MKDLKFRVQCQYLHNLSNSICGKTKSLEEIIKEIETPTVVRTSEEIEKDIEDIFEPYKRKKNG